MSVALKPLTLLVAMVVFVVGTLMGFKLLTAQADTATAAPTCTKRTVAVGEPLTTNLVTINVLNASTRAGLANRIAINLQRNGLLAGTVANSTSARNPTRVTILTNDPTDPRVKLVASQFADKVTYAKSDLPLGKGVTVLVGDDARLTLRKKPPLSVVTDRPIEVCVPVVELP